MPVARPDRPEYPALQFDIDLTDRPAATLWLGYGDPGRPVSAAVQAEVVEFAASLAQPCE